MLRKIISENRGVRRLAILAALLAETIYMVRISSRSRFVISLEDLIILLVMPIFVWLFVHLIAWVYEGFKK